MLYEGVYSEDFQGHYLMVVLGMFLGYAFIAVCETMLDDKDYSLGELRYEQSNEHLAACCFCESQGNVRGANPLTQLALAVAVERMQSARCLCC